VFKIKSAIKTAGNSGLAILPFSFSAENPQLNSYLYFQFTFTVRQHRQATNR